MTAVVPVPSGHSAALRSARASAMFVQVHTAGVRGVEGFPVRVEVNLAPGLPGFTVVGLAQGSVREGRERVAAALRNSGFGLPNRKITVNLAPADVRKVGTAFDLPIAIGILAAAGQVPRASLGGLVFVGELGLDGTLQPVPGVLPAALRSSLEGAAELVVPEANADEAALVRALSVRSARSLTDVVDHLTGAAALGRVPPPTLESVEPQGSARGDLTDVRGQQSAKRALEIAAAGDHNILLIGPPGSGKTMLARRLVGLLPGISLSEAIEIARVHSVAGMLLGTGLPTTRPFRAPHHSISYAGLHGGGNPLRPGEVSLAHHGVLFLDELPEFRRDALEMLRQPLEEGWIGLSRAGGAIRFPSRVLLVAAMNPCPCGYFGDGADRCICDPASIARYRARVSGPLLDRIDLHVEVGAVAAHDLLGPASGATSAEVASRVRSARERGARRRRAGAGAAATASTRATPDALRLLSDAIARVGLSARGHDRVLRVARTIADLAGSPVLDAEHLAESLQFRPMHNGQGGEMPR